MSNLHPLFENILKPHLQGQNVVARKRDTIRYNALHKGWQETGGLISFGTFVAAVDKYEATRDEAHLDAQYEKEMNRNRKADWYCQCGLAHIPTVPDCPSCGDTKLEREKEAEREERRQYREWRNDSGV